MKNTDATTKFKEMKFFKITLLSIYLLIFSLKIFADTTQTSAAPEYYATTNMWLAFEDRMLEADFDMNDAVFYLKIHTHFNNCSGNMCNIQEMVVVITPAVAGAMDELTLQFNPYLSSGFPHPQYHVIEHRNAAEGSPISQLSTINTPFTTLYKGVDDMFIDPSCRNMVNIDSAICQGKTRAFTFYFNVTDAPVFPIINMSAGINLERALAEFFHLENCSEGHGNSYKGNTGTLGYGMLGEGSIVALMQAGTAMVPNERASLDTAFNLDYLGGVCDIRNGFWSMSCEAAIETAINNGTYSAADIYDLKAPPGPVAGHVFNRPEVSYQGSFDDTELESHSYGGGDYFNETHPTLSSDIEIREKRSHCNIVKCDDTLGAQFINGGGSVPSGSVCGP
jgi:hypothetical protein